MLLHCFPERHRANPCQDNRFTAPAKPLNAFLVLGLWLALSGCGPATPAQAEAQQSGGSAGLSAGQRPGAQAQNGLAGAIRVLVEPAVAGRIHQAGAVTGIVSAFRKATVAAEVGGRVVRRHVEPGTPVKANDVLVSLDQVRMRNAREEARAMVAARKVDLAQSRADLRRGEALFAEAVISVDARDDLRFTTERAEAQLTAALSGLAVATRSFEDTLVRAPFAGTAERIHVHEGDYVAPGQPVALLADFSQARVIAGVTAGEAAALEKDTVVQLSFEALGGGSLSGAIASVGRIADESSGTYPVEIWVAGEEADFLREGMVAAVTFPAATSARSTLVPRSAVLRRHGAMHVFVVERGIARLQAVRVGRSDGKHVEVLEGVRVGDQVVIDGLFALKDGASVAIGGS